MDPNSQISIFPVQKFPNQISNFRKKDQNPDLTYADLTYADPKQLHPAPVGVTISAQPLSGLGGGRGEECSTVSTSTIKTATGTGQFLPSAEVTSRVQ